MYLVFGFLLTTWSPCNKSLPLIEKKNSPKITVSFNEIFSVHLSMNKFHNVSVILSKNMLFFPPGH